MNKKKRAATKRPEVTNIRKNTQRQNKKSTRTSKGLPPPPYPADVDLRGFPYMPLDIQRLLDSDLFALSNGPEFKAAVALWCRSWYQIPAGSLPQTDYILARLSGAGSNWRNVHEMALHGWTLCSDGRLYHPVVAEKVLEAWSKRKSQRNRVNKRWHPNQPPDTAVSETDTAGIHSTDTAGNTAVIQEKGIEGKGIEKKLAPLVVPTPNGDDHYGRDPRDPYSRGGKMKKSAWVMSAAFICAVSAEAGPVNVSFSTTSVPPLTFLADTFSELGTSGSLALDSSLLTTNAINIAVFTVEMSCCASTTVTLNFDLTLDGVTHTLTQMANWFITFSFDSIQAQPAATPVRFDTPAGSWEVELNRFSVSALFFGEFRANVTADFDPVPAVPEPATLALLSIGLAGLGFARRKLN